MNLDSNLPENFTISEELLRKTTEVAEMEYKSHPDVYCPYFKEKIYFNTKGFEHIKFKEWNKSRIPQDQYLRLKMLRLVPEIINKSATVQGIFDTSAWERIKRKDGWIKLMKKVTYYELVAVVGKGRVRLKVIIKEIEGGSRFFWSVIPFWKMNKNIKKKIVHEGNPEID